ncbi:hypothetical protein ILUMI_16787 [Ignelater luminosus]|uniref:Uncharacterized protein n=1 Tax=Ignelater luminosus TaxID=2038154 RepID=A0A8K0CPK7_IGNLU|nr:hypothetical protein ILUMI_16787 [Ignelater luminosus]
MLASMGDDYDDVDMIEVVYVPPDIDEMTDKENLDNNIIEEGNIDVDIVGTCELHSHVDSGRKEGRKIQRRKRLKLDGRKLTLLPIQNETSK